MWYHSPLRSIPLHKATQKGDSVEVAALLAQGADVSARDAEGRSPLHHAVMRGHLHIVDMLIDNGGPGLLLAKDILGCTPVHLAAVQNQVTLIRKLVTALLKDQGGTTPLHEVARRQCMQDFMGFLHLGWDIAAREDTFSQDLSQCGPAWAELAKHVDLTRPGMAAVVRTMGWQPLHLAAMEGKVELVQRLVKHHSCNMLERSANSWTSMHYAAAHNQVAVLDALVQLGCDPSIKDSVMSTPIHVAAGEGHTEAILKLVALGSDPGAKDRDGCTPLYCAAAWNRPAAVRQLDKLGCHSWVRSEEGRTPVHVAAEQGWVQLVDLLVRELKNKVDSRDAYQFTPLHSAANGGHVGTIQKLISFSHDVDVRDYLGRTPLHYAALHGRAAAVEELVKQGAAHGARDHRGGYTPLHLAADSGQCEVISRLFELGADLEAVSTKGWTPLALANMKGPANVDAIGLLVELGASLWPVMKDTDVETPLHMASRSGRLDIVQKLLRCGADHSKKTKDGSTPLHYAAAFGQTHVLEALVQAGVPVDSRDDACNTPLHLAAGCGFLDTVTKLVKLGADVNAQDLTQCTPLQNAAHGTYSALATMPLNGSQSGATGNALQHSTNRSMNGAVGALPQQHLTPAQQAAQAAITAPATQRDGKVPVRTGLAWAALAGHAQATAASMHTDFGGASVAEYCNLGLLQLLKKASRQRSGPPLAPPSPAHQPHSHALPGQDAQSLGRSHTALQYYAGSKSDIDAGKELGYEALLKHTEALQLNSMEQDRARLIPVAERLVKLGADAAAHDMEGRTALHLAAGCGDKHMVVRLVALGTDVNCKDSVGGTPMHHAAMANKKEMMFTLARLGCDWRARAEGIDGATAAFVLCGQHTRTTRQQLVEAKLKRAYQEGQAARAAGHDPLAADLAATAHRLHIQAVTQTAPPLFATHVSEETVPAAVASPASPHALASSSAEQRQAAVPPEQGRSAAQADANMAALLQEEAGRLAESGRKRPKRKKKTCRSSEAGSGVTATAAADDPDTDQPLTPQSELDSDSTGAWNEPMAAPSATTADANTGVSPVTGAAAAATAAKSSGHSCANHRQHGASAHHSHSSSADNEHEPTKKSGATGPSQDKAESARSELEAAVSQATAALEVGTAAGDDVLQQVLNDLDKAITSAAPHSLSLKHSRKIRFKLHALLLEAINIAASSGDHGSSSATAHVPAAASHQWQKAGAKPVRAPSSKVQSQNHSPAPKTRHQSHSTQHHLLQQPNGLYTAGVVNHPTPPPPPPPKQASKTPTQSRNGPSRSHLATAEGLQGAGASHQTQSPGLQPRSQGGNPWGMPAKHRSSGQAASQPAASPAPLSSSSPAAGLRHGATTITDPVQMMWQQQQIQSPSNPTRPQSSGSPSHGPPMPASWPSLDQATAVVGRQRNAPAQQLQSQQPHRQNVKQPSSGFQPFVHGLPQLRTSVMHTSGLLCPPSPSQSLASPHNSLHAPASAASIHSAAASSHQSVDLAQRVHSNGNMLPPLPQTPSRLQPPLPSMLASAAGSSAFGLSMSSHSPTSSGRGSFDGHQTAAPALEEEASASTFHLPTGLTEQLSDSHQPAAVPSALAQQQQQHTAGASQHVASTAHHAPLPEASSAQLPSQSKPKLRSPPGFSRPLDGAAKPFVPSNAAWPQPGGDRQHTDSLRKPPGMSPVSQHLVATSMDNGTSPQVQCAHPTASNAQAKRGQQHANLATGQWAMASQDSGFGLSACVRSPFDNDSGPSNFAASNNSHDSWQVPAMQAQKSQQVNGEPAVASFLDSEHDKTSGLAPHEVLDFLGIGLSAEGRTSSMSQPVT